MARLLLVDDDVNVARSIARALRAQHLTTTVTHDLAAAEAALADGDFDLVLCDLALGTRSGLELLSQLEARRDTTPFVLITGCLGDQRPDPRALPRVAAIVAKPFDAATIGEVVTRVLDEHAGRRPGS